MSKGANSVIHTKSSYGPSLSVNVTSGKSYSIDTLYSNAMRNLQKAELSFYHQFFPDVNTIDDFLSRIRKLLAAADGVENYLKRFTNANLKQFLPNTTSYFEMGYEIELQGDIKEIVLNYEGPSCYMKGDLTLAVVPENAQLIKHILNVILKRNKINSFHDNEKITKNLVNTLEKEGERLFGIKTEKTTSINKTFDITTVTKTDYNKGKDSEIKKLLNSNSPENKKRLDELRGEMRKSLNEMKQFLFRGLPSGEPELRQAVEETWKSVVPLGNDMLLRDFFFEGKNYNKSLLGQPGEFINKVLFLYIGKKVKNPVGAEIIGSLIKGGQQPHTDLQIMTALGANIGFQTKNINGTRDIDVNTNAALIQNNFGSNIISPLVNYYTNTDYAQSHSEVIESVKKILEDRFFQAMNLNISPELDDLQTNTFYFVGGENIVPGSEIIKDIMKLESRPQFEIKGGNVSPSSSDQGYKDNFEDYLYWKYPKGVNNNPSAMVPTEKNPPDFNSAAASISIQTSFNVTSLIDSGRFRIFY